MKKCPDCEKEIDKYTFACEYCGRLFKLSSTEKDRKNSHKNTDEAPPRRDK